MYFVRTTKTASKSTAVQIVRYEQRRKIIVKHVGSAHNEEELLELKQTARDWIEKASKQQSLFPPSKKPTSRFIPLNKCQYLGVRYAFIYEVLTRLFRLLRFSTLKNQLLLDLVLMRIIQPVSKLESLEYLEDWFGVSYKKGSLYQSIPSFLKLKETVEEKAVAFAKNQYHFDFSFVFYDVTTLYIESSTEDTDTTDDEGNVITKGLRKGGFSKDNKFNQPQIVIGLIVTKEGFPVAYEVFEGNTFEGDTFIPVIYQFKKRYAVDTLTVVADAAMISLDNIEKLQEHRLSYIVGARTTNLKLSQMKEISAELIGKIRTDEELEKKDGGTYRITTERGLLLCGFSFKRYRKDRRDMEKQIIRASSLVAKNTDRKRTKFLKLKKSKKEKVYTLNTELIERAKLMIGIKGYYTNLFKKDNTLTDQDVIDHYHNLWHVEKAFRIAKSDLQMRPIYHFKKQAIEAHILICFMALAVCKYMELKTGKSTKKIIKLLKSITDARIKNLLTGEIIVLRQELSEEVEQLWKTLS